MRKLLSYGLIAAITVISTAVKVGAEPPPREPVISAESVVLADCISEQCLISIR